MLHKRKVSTSWYIV